VRALSKPFNYTRGDKKKTLNIQQNISLKPYNTFGLDVKATAFIEITSLNNIKTIIAKQKDFFILSGGSNLLLTRDIDKLVIHLNLKGKEMLSSIKNEIYVKVQAGENWHDFVLWCIKNGFGGVENMSLIPGNVGTAPIQNIGAYGVELKDSMHELEALEIATGDLKKFSNKSCEFGYRNSVFKNKLKRKYVITSVTFELSKKNHKLNSSYGAIQTELDKNKINKPTIKDISNAVITIRQSKLPDPDEIGNSGSFFKNPVVSKKTFKTFQKKNPDAPFYELEDGNYKIPAGWLIEKCGLKGKRIGDAGVHEKQALVLVNYGNATGKEIWELALKIQNEVKNKFQIEISPEVNVIK